MRVARNFAIYSLDSPHVSLAAGAIYEDSRTTGYYVCCAPALPAAASEIYVQNPGGHHQPASGTGAHCHGVLRLLQEQSSETRPAMVGQSGTFSNVLLLSENGNARLVGRLSSPRRKHECLDRDRSPTSRPPHRASKSQGGYRTALRSYDPLD